MKEISGVIPVLKSAGMTSHDVVAILRKKLGIKKIGHTGTLDPMVTGVLPVLVGRATRLSDFYMDVPKTYAAVGSLGIATDTEDGQGRIISESDISHITEEDVRKALELFVGEIVQIPPDYSAVKIRGKKLIDYTHRGMEMPEKKARTVSVYDIRFGGYEQGDFRFDITCSKGTYVRTICADLGKALHVPAHMKDLVRTESGGFRLSDAIPLEDVSPASILWMDDAVKKIYNMSRVILPRKEEILHRLENGIRFDVRTRAVSIETSNRNGEVSVERDVQKIRQWNSCDGKNGFLYVEDRFYGILNSNFELDRLIKDK